MAGGMPVKRAWGGIDGSNEPSAKKAQKGHRAYRRWSEEEKRVLWEHPGMSSAALAAIMPGRSPVSVRRARARFGRTDGTIAGLCVRCDDRPVWGESARARKMRLCKGCYLREEAMRLEEERESARVRKMRERGGGGKG